MDEELKTWLAAMEARLDQRFDARLKDTEARLEQRFDARLDARLDEAFTRFSQHILNEMGSRFDEVKAQLNSMDARLKLHAGLIQSGARAMARFSKFGEDSEEPWVSLVGRVAAPEKRLEGK
jgi:hypothetical protein